MSGFASMLLSPTERGVGGLGQANWYTSTLALM